MFKKNIYITFFNIFVGLYTTFFNIFLSTDKIKRKKKIDINCPQYS